ncbi:sulfur carrier protein ThiS [Pollutimonas thiosulfatoxidans]|uniref:Thiamine biosynthesis protein ThiS n=1 Tax=Pollutimonas thiosulfatoxidans TaxID=2028345 RepID=A0A410G8D1_9BURK|nr:sulfur carrier protein ThiS [Pollutimonas thiosulfatoxidans]MBF6617965.1 sulfur carrier protein ThiS [Candidimonas sp.]NYT43800.1 sulfur carrier protein ThiS [Alcaligenaceae bacterium]QAA92465.1 thiamine biosynthesis protein ThiS [Pollutimonas thiosulfatoxidans]
MNIILNGKPMQVDQVRTVADLIVFLEYEGKRIAVERNGDIVPKSQHGETALAEGDELEIVVAVGGG